jgi:hypothetical protein
MGEGCCPRPKTKLVEVAGNQIGIIALEPSIRKVGQMNLSAEEEIRSDEYADALLREYLISIDRKET